MAAPRKTFSPVFLYALVSLTAFFPCLILGRAYFANDLMNSYGHFRAFLRNQLLQGHFPLWNPYLMGGQPFFAHPCSMMCYPPTYLTLPFSIPYGLSLFFFLHMAWAALGMHLWLKKLGLGPVARGVGALSFALSGFFWWELIHPNLLAVFAWFPWFLLCLEECALTFRPRWAFFSGLSFAVIFACGHFQAATYVFYSGTAYFLFRLPALRRAGGKTLDGRKAFWLLLFAVWGGLPLLAHLIPALEYFRASTRNQASSSYGQLNALGSMRPGSLPQFLFPAIGVPEGSTLEFHIQSFDDDTGLENNFFGALGYVGVWAPFLMVLAFFQGRDKKWFYFLGAMALAGLLSACGRYFPLHRLECALLPGIGLSRAPYRFLLVYVLFACALCAFGFERLEQILADKKRGRAYVRAGAIYALLLSLVALKNPSQAGWEILCLAAGAAGLFVWAHHRRWKQTGRGLFLASILASLLAAGWSGYSLGPASNFDLEKNFPAFSSLRENREEGRYYFDPSLSYEDRSSTSTFRCFFPEDSVMALGVRSAGSYGGFELQRAVDLREVPFNNFLRLMAVRGLLFGHSVAAPAGYRDIPFGETHLYESNWPPSLLFAPPVVRSGGNEEENLAAMKQPDFDPYQSALVGGPLPEGFAASPSGSPANPRYSLLRDEPDDQIFKVQLDHGNLVVFSEMNFPGWKARVDGQPAALLTADHALRSLFIPAGEHEVEFRYQPFWFKPIIAGAGLWLLSLVFYGLFRLRQKPSKGGTH